MLHFFKKLLIKGVLGLTTHGWLIIVILLLCLYISGYAFMWLFDEQAVLQSYTWWFVVTVTTVGYGDIAPVSEAGRWTAIIIMFFGIGAIALLIGKIAEWIILMSEKQHKGLLPLKVSNHILIMGYRPNKTDRLVQELLADTQEDKVLVLCSTTLRRNPFNPEKVKFVHADELTSEQTLQRACCHCAQKIIILRANDDQSFFTAFAVRQINTFAHMVVFMNNTDHVNKIQALPADHKELNQTILPSAIQMVVQEIQDPQSSLVLQQLMSNLQGATLYRLDLPAQMDKYWTFETLFIFFRRHYQATLLALRDPERKHHPIINNPDLKMIVKPSMSLFYVATHRLANIDWQHADLQQIK